METKIVKPIETSRATNSEDQTVELAVNLGGGEDWLLMYGNDMVTVGITGTATMRCGECEHCLDSDEEYPISTIIEIRSADHAMAIIATIAEAFAIGPGWPHKVN